VIKICILVFTLVCPILSDLEFSHQVFKKKNIKFYENTFNVPCRRTDGHTTKLTVAFPNFAKAPNNSYSPSVIHILCSCNTFVCAADSSWLCRVSGL
jgi:hypothetical protein